MEFFDLFRYLFALLLVVALIVGAGLASRRFGLPGLVKPHAQKRLVVVETLMMGPRQRLLILKRDHVEHLILTGPDGATVIESGFQAPPRSLTSQNADPIP